MTTPAQFPMMAGAELWLSAWDYTIDATQRSVLFWDTLRRRGNQAEELRRRGHPPVLRFAYEMLMDGRKLPRPVNYALLRIKPGNEFKIDPAKRPFIVVDPRAGQAPGIGGFKQDSEIGVALAAGHPVYFISFFERPMPGQSLADVSAAEAAFVEEVGRRHADADKPCVIGNCQAGWAVAMLAALHPGIVGAILLAGAPLAYWSGVSGRNPMRYTGGLLGGKWLESLACDLGNGLFDGAYLIENFESLDPANSLWTKYYSLYSKIDTEADRFLDFEAWWTGYFFMNEEEMDTIVSDLFIGNKLERGLERQRDGDAIDLSRITAPVVILASRADNITPPQQALDWIDDVYGSEQTLIDHDRTIVYLLREDVGHLAIFVSSRVAKKEFTELVGTLEMIEALPPGLYQMVINPKAPKSPHVDLEPGQYLVRFESRKMADIRSIEGKRQMEPLFQTVERVSRLNDAAYKVTARPWIRLATTEGSAQLFRQVHPERIVREFFSDLNPVLASTARLAPAVRALRHPVSEDNPWLALEHLASETIVALLDAYRDVRDMWYEHFFQMVYGPWGWGAIFPPKRLARQNLQLPEPPPLTHADFVRGGIIAAVFRLAAAACLDVGVFDHRSAIILQSVLAHKRFKHLDQRQLRALFRLQARLLRASPSRAADALGQMLPSAKDRQEALSLARQVLEVVPREEAMSGALSRRLLEAIRSSSGAVEHLGLEELMFPNSPAFAVSTNSGSD